MLITIFHISSSSYHSILPFNITHSFYYCYPSIFAYKFIFSPMMIPSIKKKDFHIYNNQFLIVKFFI